MKLTIWLKKPTTIYLGGNPEVGQAPVLTAELQKPQILVDPDKSTVVIVETK